MNRAGYVLVGGASARMGRHKALLPFRGGALATHVARAVELAAGSTVLVGDPILYSNLGYPVIPDLYPGEGPLGGLVTALRHTTAEWNLVAACDMPGVTESLLRRILAEAERAGAEADAVIPAGPSGRPEPLCAAYRLSALPLIEAGFADGMRRMTAALERLRTVTMFVEEVACFQNLNTPEEWAGYVAD